MSTDTQAARTTSADIGRRGLAVGIAVVGVIAFAALAVAVYSVLSDKVGGAAPVIFVAALAAEVGVFMPVVSLVHRLWLAGDAGLRHSTEQRVQRERAALEVSREYERRRREALRARDSTRPS